MKLKFTIKWIFFLPFESKSLSKVAVEMLFYYFFIFFIEIIKVSTLVASIKHTR
jgi:hypothetical protein